MRRRTQRLGSRRTIIYIVILVVLVAVNYLRSENSAEASEEMSVELPSATPDKVVEKSVEKPAPAPAPKKKAKSNKGKTSHSGWAELPAEMSGEELYTTYHLDSQGRRNFTVCYNSKHHSPMWVAVPMHRCYKGDTKRVDNYDYDPTLPVNIQIRLSRSYGEYTRGHMLGSAERNASRELNNQTFYVSNIAPQMRDGFNQSGGAWNNLESFVDKQMCTDTLYIVTGAIYERYTDTDGTIIEPRTTTNKSDGKQVGVPTAYYKALLRTKEGNTGRSVMECSREELKCAAFIVGHRSAQKRKPTRKEMLSIDELERLTGVDFFAGVENAPEDVAKAEEWGL